MRPSSLPPAERFEHGIRARYATGCRCDSCRKANRDYERGRIAARRDGDWNGLTSSEPARKHLLMLEKAGVGRRTIERLTNIPRSILYGIKCGTKLNIRARTSKLILSVTEVYTRAPIAGELGYCEPCWKDGKHLCFATVKKRGVAKCDPCAAGKARCDYRTGMGWFRGNGDKGRPHDLTPTKKLSSKHPHGHYMKYMGGCRCAKCKLAAREYNERLRQNRILLGPNNLVPTTKVKARLIQLMEIGIGHQTVAKYTGVGKTGLAEILWYGKQYMRRRAANAVLAFKPTLDNFPKNKQVPARATVAKLRRMTVKWGMPRTLVTRDALGNRTAGLQIPALAGKTTTVRASTAVEIRDYFQKVERMREMWVQAHGPIPRRHYVSWKPGRHGMRLTSLELRPFHVGYDYHNLPQDLKELVLLKGKLKRAYRGRAKELRDGKKQNSRPEKPPVRAA